MTLLATDPLDLALDPATGDLALDANGSPYMICGLPGVAQLIRIALGMFQGEWFLDLSTGMPWVQSILGSKYNNAQMLNIFRSTILAVTGVAGLASLTASFDGQTRMMTVNFEAVAVFGGTVADSLTFGNNTPPIFGSTT